MTPKAYLFLCLALSGVSSQGMAQGTFDYTKEKIQNEWKAGLGENGLLKDGLSCVVRHGGTRNCKIHYSENSLIAETDRVIFVYSPDKAFAVHKKENGYGLIGVVENKSVGDKAAQLGYMKSVHKLQGSLGIEFSQLFPFEIPGPFRSLATAVLPGWGWIFQSPFVEIESIVKGNDGLVTLTFVEDSVKKYGDRGSWRRVNLKLDPQKGWNVTGLDWISLNPNLEASGIEMSDYAEIPGKPGAWAVRTHSSLVSALGTKNRDTRKKFAFTDFQIEKLDENTLNLSHYGITKPKESYWNHFGWLTSTTIPPAGKK